MFDKASLKLGLDKAVLQDINRKGNLNGVKYHISLEYYYILLCQLLVVMFAISFDVFSCKNVKLHWLLLDTGAAAF